MKVKFTNYEFTIDADYATYNHIAILINEEQTLDDILSAVSNDKNFANVEFVNDNGETVGTWTSMTRASSAYYIEKKNDDKYLVIQLRQKENGERIDEIESKIDEFIEEMETKIEELTYTLRQVSENVQIVEKKDDSEMPVGDYVNPIPYETGDTVVANKFYTDGDDIWMALKDGTPVDFADTEYFDIVTA